jgi:hypothetical protein
VWAVTGPGCAPAFLPRYRCFSGGGGHQFQLRTTRSFRRSVRAALVTSSSCASRASSRARVEWKGRGGVPETFRDDVTRLAAWSGRRGVGRKGQTPPPMGVVR